MTHFSFLGCSEILQYCAFLFIFITCICTGHSIDPFKLEAHVFWGNVHILFIYLIIHPLYFSLLFFFFFCGIPIILMQNFWTNPLVFLCFNFQFFILNLFILLFGRLLFLLYLPTLYWIFQWRFPRALSCFLNIFYSHLASWLWYFPLFLRRCAIWGKFSFASCSDHSFLWVVFFLLVFVSLSYVGDFFSDVLSSFIVCSCKALSRIFTLCQVLPKVPSRWSDPAATAFTKRWSFASPLVR